MIRATYSVGVKSGQPPIEQECSSRRYNSSIELGNFHIMRECIVGMSFSRARENRTARNGYLCAPSTPGPRDAPQIACILIFTRRFPRARRVWRAHGHAAARTPRSGHGRPIKMSLFSPTDVIRRWTRCSCTRWGSDAALTTSVVATLMT